MSVSQLLAQWRGDATVWENVTAAKEFPARPARTAPFPKELHPSLRTALEASGIQALYTHQASAWKLVKGGKNIVVVTGTASGKTLCFNLSVVDRLLRDPEARALYLYPTRALSQDQNSKLAELNDAFPKAERIATGTYNSDTTQQQRPKVRKRARILISTPDMLHLGILPHHTKWVEFFSKLRFVVLDEMHSYRGLFGSHLANILRRMKRITQFYGAFPQFILTSATIANPVELAKWLIEEPVELVEDDGAPRGPKQFLIYNPPIVNPDLGIRQSSLQESVRLTSDLLAHQLQTILFCRTRRMVELSLNYLRQDAAEEPEKIRGYRSGYLPRKRREIEEGLRSGEVRAVAATTALELGVDIGGMGAAILSSYPGTIAATWQQAGRAGRSMEPSLAALVASANPLNQFLAHHPDYFFGRSPEQALVNPNNPNILSSHMRCAVYELPFREGEGFGSIEGEQVVQQLQALTEEGDLHHSGDKYFWMSEGYPAQGVNIRGATPDKIVLLAKEAEKWHTIGELEMQSAYWMAHPDAIYLHEGEAYIVEELDEVEKVARLHPTDADYYTVPQSDSDLIYLHEDAQAETQGATKFKGQLATTSQVVGYHKIQWYTNERVGVGHVEMPAVELHTRGYWIVLAEGVVEGLRSSGLWQGDRNKYGANWEAQKQRARERDNYRCQNCGRAEEGRAHDVHHKIPFRSFATYKEANRLENLITLCSSCHRLAETAVRMRSGLSGLAFTIKHLAPLFLMCDPGDLGVHANPQAPLLEGRPMIAIYDHAAGGVGFSERLYELHEELMQRANELVSECECSDGCPSCVGPGGENGQGGKQETLAILKSLAG